MDELRERCIRAVGGPRPTLNWGALVDDILAEIEAAGYRIVPVAALEHALAWAVAGEQGRKALDQLDIERPDDYVPGDQWAMLTGDDLEGQR